MPDRWLFKSEPDDFAYEDLVRGGKTEWDGIRNPTALKYIRNVKKGDEIFYYHTGKVKAVVGIAKAVTDSRDDTVFIAPVRALSGEVSLKAIKANPKLRDLDLVRISRLSVMPVSSAHWNEILRMSA